MAIVLEGKNALIFAADAGVKSILQAFKLAMPKAVIALIIGKNGAENVEEIKDKAGWMIDSFDLVNLERNFDLVLDSTRELIERYQDLGYKVYVSISSSFPEISAALYAATMYKGGVPLSPEAQNPELPMLRVLILPETALVTLKVLYEECNGRATLDDLSNKVYEALLKRKKERKREKSKAMVNYHVNRRLKPLGLVRTRIDKKKLGIELTNAGIAVAKRVDDYLKFLEKPKGELAQVSSYSKIVEKQI